MGLTELFFVKILRGAVVEVIGKWRPLLRALTVPAVLMIGTSYATQYLLQWHFSTYGSFEGLKVLGYVQAGVWLLLYVLFGISCHRIILLGDTSLPNRFGLYWTLRETRFLGWAVLVGAIHMLIIYLFKVTAIYLPFFGPPEYKYWQITWYLPMLLATYIDGRISLVLPATAVDQRSSIVESWRLTRGRGLHIAAALLITAFASDLLGSAIISFLKELGLAARLVSNAINFPLVAVAVGIVSITYRELRES